VPWWLDRNTVKGITAVVAFLAIVAAMEATTGFWTQTFRWLLWRQLP
jgi:hypothetical protein